MLSQCLHTCVRVTVCCFPRGLLSISQRKGGKLRIFIVRLLSFRICAGYVLEQFLQILNENIHNLIDVFPV